MKNTNKKVQYEYDFVTAFVQCYQLKKSREEDGGATLYALQGKGANQSSYADCEIIYDNVIVKIEAKLLNDTLGNSSSFYNLIGELILLSLQIPKNANSKYIMNKT